MKTSIMDLLEYCFASAPKYNPDGSAVAFLSYRAKTDKSGYDSFVNVISPADGKALGFMAPVGVSSLGWLNSETLAVTLSQNGHTVVYALTEDGDCNIWGTVPFSAKIVDGTTENQLLLTAARPINDEKAQEDGHYTVLDEFPFWYDGKGFISKVRTQLFLMEENGEPALISPINLDVSHVVYDVSSRKVVFTGVEVNTIRPDWDCLGLYDLNNRSLSMPIHTRQWRIRQVAVLDGKPVIVASGVYESYYATPRVLGVEKDGTYTVIAAPGMHIANSVVTDVCYGSGNIIKGFGDCVCFVVTEGYGSQLYRMDKNGVLERLTCGEGQISGFDMYRGQVVFTGLRDMHLPEVYLLENGTEKSLTCLNGGAQTAMPEDISVINSENVPVYGIIRKPDVPANQKCPGILIIHGGPNGAFGHVWHHEMQLLCDQGYYVFACNPTGSDGRGETFGDVSGRWGTVDYDDIMRFVDKVLETYPQIDASRLGVFGGSYGGYMTNWIIGHTDRFACAISDRSISNCPSKDVTGDNGIRFGEMHMKTNVYENPEYMWDRSPLKYAYQVKTPTLFIHGEADTRCHLSQATMMFTAIRENGVPARMAIFKGETHELCRSGKPCNRLRRLMEVQKWLDLYCCRN